MCNCVHAHTCTSHCNRGIEYNLTSFPEQLYHTAPQTGLLGPCLSLRPQNKLTNTKAQVLFREECARPPLPTVTLYFASFVQSQVCIHVPEKHSGSNTFLSLCSPLKHHQSDRVGVSGDLEKESVLVGYSLGLPGKRVLMGNYLGQVGLQACLYVWGPGSLGCQVI